MEARKDREREFHDARFGSEAGRNAGRFYATAGASRDAYRRRLLLGAPGRQVLEYGCGPGSHAFELARLGASVTAIDISPVAIDLGRRRAETEGLPVGFHVMDAEKLAFPNASFDLVCGTGILHHLDIEQAYHEIARVLKPSGTAVFLEPLGHNPLINLYRARTPEQRTADEHPLLLKDIRLANRFFSAVDISYFHLTTLAAIPFASKPFAAVLSRALDKVDRALFAALPAARRYAWIFIATFGGPRPEER